MKQFTLSLFLLKSVIDKGFEPVWVLRKARHGITLTLPTPLSHKMMKNTVYPTSSKPDQDTDNNPNGCFKGDVVRSSSEASVD